MKSTAEVRHPDTPLFARRYLWPFLLVTSLFFLWGIANNLNDVLIRQFMKSFEMTRLRAGLIQSAFYMGYFLLSMPAALLMRRFGYKTGLVTGLLLFSTGAMLFWPAALLWSYAFFLIALFIIAGGLAFLETGANSFIAQLGDPETSERRLNFSQAFNPLGAVSGVLIGTTFIFSGVELTNAQVLSMKASNAYATYMRHETLRVIPTYVLLSLVVLVAAILMMKTRFPSNEGPSQTVVSTQEGSFSNLLRYPHFIQAVIAQFFYVGAQVGTWSYFIQYVQDYVHASEKTAGLFLTGTLVAFGVGRFSATVLMKYVRPNRLMALYSVINVLLVALGVLFPGWLGLWAIFLTSFFMSLMFPTIFALGLKELGPNTKLGGSLIVMAIIGGAVFTPLMGLVFEHTHSMADAMLIPLGCYLFITYFALVGSRVRPGSLAQ